MKKNLTWIFIFTILFTGCITKGTFTAHKEHLQFMGNPTTGYIWFMNISDESVIDVTENIMYLGEENITGAPSLFMYTVTSLKPGKATLSFEYKLGWENKNPEQIKKYEVTVYENGKIKMKTERE